MSETLQAPFVWFGGKSRAADLVWSRLGNVDSYVEPFAGSLAVLLGRPHEPHIESVNDRDGFVANAWRSIAFDPDATAHYADWPVNEADLHARHLWLVNQRDSLTERLMADPEFYDAKVAGYWLWGVNCWIGSGWCSGQGPWKAVDGKLTDTRQSGPGREPETAAPGNPGQGVNRQLPHLGDAGQGVNRKLPHLGDAGKANGVNRQLPHLGNAGRGIIAPGERLLPWFHDLAARLRRVRVCCGDWTRVMGPSVLWPTGGVCGVLLDPPYSGEERAMGLYAVDSGSVAAQVRQWAIEHGDDPNLRLALCGYDGEHDMPDGWIRETWSARGGYDGQRKSGSNDNRFRESIWFSRHCLNPAESLPLFAGMEQL